MNMIKVVLVSDNHANSDVIRYILNKEQDANMYLHCGDSGMSSQELLPFVAVKGNNDFDMDYPIQRIINIKDKKVLIIHGNPYVSLFSSDGLIDKAIKEGVDVVFYGHTHIFKDNTKNGIRFINPGSCHYNRDGSLPSYALVYFGDDKITVERKFVDPKEYTNDEYYFI